MEEYGICQPTRQAARGEFRAGLATRTIIDGELFHTIEREVNHTVERIQGVIKPLVYLSTGGEEYDKMRRRIYVQVFDESTKADTKSYQYVDQTLDIENTMSTRLAVMPPEIFFRIFYPIVSEDTWKLILVGAILGFGAGCLQWLLLRP